MIGGCPYEGCWKDVRHERSSLGTKVMFDKHSRTQVQDVMYLWTMRGIGFLPSSGSRSVGEWYL